MIYLQIIFGWAVIVFLILCMLYCLLMFCEETDFLSEYLPWFKMPLYLRRPLSNIMGLGGAGWGVGCLGSILFFAIFAVFFIIIMFVYETFIHNKLPQKPQAVSVKQENKKAPAEKKLSKEEQIVQNVLQQQ